MTEKPGAHFEAAERNRVQILAWTGAACAALGWLVRGSSTAVAAVAAVTAYLMTGDRYQWVYIWRKTFRRDMLGLRVLLVTMYRVWNWERSGTTVVSRWAEVARRNPDKAAFVMGGRTVTFREGDEFSNRIAWYFKRQGFKRGEVIALLMETQPEYVFLWLGLAKIGVTTALVNNSLRAAQLIHSLRVAGCKACVFGDEMTEAIKEIRHEIQDLPLFQFNSPEREDRPILLDTPPLASEYKEMPSDPVPDVNEAKPRDTLMYIYTSGTTGFPKAAVITNIRYLLIPSGVHASAQLSSSDVIYDPLPLHHTAGGVLGAGQALVFGCTVALRRKFSASNYWKDAAKYKCTAAQYIGEICRYLLSVPPGPADQGHQVKTIIGNGLRPQIWESFVKRFGIDRVVEFYGATEGNSNLVNLDSKVGAIGFLSRLVSSIYPLTLVKCDEISGEMLRDASGKCISCGPHEPGLLLGKIDPKKLITSFSGYADKTASEKKMVRNVKVNGDCYFNTGDILVMDHFGYFYFKDRTGDTFRWRGENVSTAEVEGVVSTLVGLKDTIVYGVSASNSTNGWHSGAASLGVVTKPKTGFCALAIATGMPPVLELGAWSLFSKNIPNIEGKCGMTAVADPERKLDLALLSKGLKSSLPVFARPLFLRVLPEPPLTSTFKLKKKELLEQGYNPSVVSDPMYFLDQKSGEYVPFTPKMYDDLVSGAFRL